jgi:hypothetical protein
MYSSFKVVRNKDTASVALHGRDEDDKGSFIGFVGLHIAGPQASSSGTQSNDDIDKNKVSFIYIKMRLLLKIKFLGSKLYYPIYPRDLGEELIDPRIEIHCTLIRQRTKTCSFHRNLPK